VPPTGSRPDAHRKHEEVGEMLGGNMQIVEIFKAARVGIGYTVTSNEQYKHRTGSIVYSNNCPYLINETDYVSIL
jgi:hypothetical protein